MTTLLLANITITVCFVGFIAYILRCHYRPPEDRPEMLTIIELLDNRPDEWQHSELYGLQGPLNIVVDARYHGLTITRNGVPLLPKDQDSQAVRLAVTRWHTRRARIASDRLLTDMTTDDQRRLMQTRQDEITRELEYINRQLKGPVE